MGRRGVALPRGQRSQAAAQDLHGDAGTGLGHGPVFAKNDVALVVEHVGQRSTSRAAQRRASDGWDRRRGRVGLVRTGENGGSRAPHTLVLESAAGPTSAHPEGQRKATPARHTSDDGSLPSGAGSQCAGTRVGSPVRSSFLRVPPRAQLRRRDRFALCHLERAARPPSVDSRRRSVGCVRPHQPRPPTPAARLVPRQGTRRSVATGRCD